MQIATLFWIVLAALAALGVVYFQYYFRAKRRDKLNISLSFLRFLALFALFLLIINPKFSKYEYTVEKANLLVLTDNSTSMAPFRDQVESTLSKIGSAPEISDRFNLQYFNFGAGLTENDSLYLNENNTNIGKAVATVNDMYSGTKSAVVLLTDGNQTLGADYGFLGSSLRTPIYPLVIGDTTQYEDLSIRQVNANRYAFLKNKYPIEVYVSYNGPGNRSELSISVDGKHAYREQVDFTRESRTKVINAILEATSVGPKQIEVTVKPLNDERNTANNKKNVLVEVIDERTNIALVSNLLHPDIGALKKAITSNEQRSVELLKPNVDVNDLSEIDLFILYQPDPSFQRLYTYIQQKNASAFTIIGQRTNPNFLNKIQNTFKIEGNYPVMETFALLNPAFSKFDISDFSVEDFPPLNNGAGIVKTENAETLLQMKVMGSALESPLLAVTDGEQAKEAVLFGENVWKWRMQSYRNDNNFRRFDDFIGKLVLYLSATKPKNRLDVEYEPIYEGSNEVKISASYFDEAFVFDRNVDIVITVRGEESNVEREIPLLLKGSFYEADLSSLPADSYAFTVQVKNKNYSQSGKFAILDFDVEKQFVSSDYRKLSLLSQDSNGKLYFPGQIDSLIQDITGADQYTPTQKGRENIVSLIDFRWLLGIIVVALSLEWAIRKYNGLI